MEKRFKSAPVESLLFVRLLTLLVVFSVVIDERAGLLGQVLSSQRTSLNVFVIEDILKARENF